MVQQSKSTDPNIGVHPLQQALLAHEQPPTTSLVPCTTQPAVSKPQRKLPQRKAEKLLKLKGKEELHRKRDDAVSRRKRPHSSQREDGLSFTIEEFVDVKKKHLGKRWLLDT